MSAVNPGQGLNSVLGGANELRDPTQCDATGRAMLRSTLKHLWAWLNRLMRDPLAILAFVLAVVVGGGATFLVLWMSALLGLIFALVGIPVIFGLLSFVPRVGGALSLGGNIGTGIVLVALIV